MKPNSLSPKGQAGWRMAGYRALARAIAPIWGGVRDPYPVARPFAPRVWFHGASAGEWEGLLPVAQHWAQDGSRLVASVLSRSGEAKMETVRLRAQAEAAALSPLEGHWMEALSRWKPRAFVTWKYDLWPDLLATLSELGIPLIILGGAARGSLRLALWLSRLLGFAMPRVYVLPFSEADRRGLMAFGRSDVIETGPVVPDSRWERVLELAGSKQDRAELLWKKLGSATQSSVILAQVWPEDLQFWLETGAFARAQGAFQIWIVPHRVDGSSIERFKDQLLREGISFATSSTSGNTWAGGGDCECILVDEMGVLNGLYPHMEWAYVGGGFGRGVHSVIEPAVHGLPISIGDRRTDRFPEVQELQGTGQLTVLRRGKDLTQWLGDRIRERTHPMANQWRAEHSKRKGGGAAIVAAIRAWLNWS